MMIMLSEVERLQVCSAWFGVIPRHSSIRGKGSIGRAENEIVHYDSIKENNHVFM